MLCGSEKKSPVRVIQIKISKPEKLANKGCNGDCVNYLRNKKPD